MTTALLVAQVALLLSEAVYHHSHTPTLAQRSTDSCPRVPSTSPRRPTRTRC
jgi:hypothetical protein